MSTHPKDISDINRFRKEGLSMRKAIEAVLLERGQGEFIP
jgi:conjugal transfer ATP-binding protein TraC